MVTVMTRGGEVAYLFVGVRFAINHRQLAGIEQPVADPGDVPRAVVLIQRVLIILLNHQGVAQ